jgi:hypothetical protein
MAGKPTKAVEASSHAAADLPIYLLPENIRPFPAELRKV